MSILYEIVEANEKLKDDPAPPTSETAMLKFEEYYETFKPKAEKIAGRLMAMIKKLTGEGSVNTKIKYIKTTYINSPSKLVTYISTRLTDQILFNRKILFYDTKELNHPIAKRICEEHYQAITELIKMKDTINVILEERQKRKEQAEQKNNDQEISAADREIKNTNRNFQIVARHIMWSSKRVLANVRLK
jgi:hypothetical protein